MKTSKTYFTLLCFSVILASACSSIKQGMNYTKNWQGSDLPGHIYATFDGFNGKQEFNAKSFANGRMHVKYSTDVPTGEMHLEIKCNSKLVLNRDVSGKVRDSVLFENPGNEPVQFIFKAKNAAGKFDLTY
jgi:hypothetical protein